MATNPDLSPLPDRPPPANAAAAWPDDTEPVPLAVWPCAQGIDGLPRTGRNSDADAAGARPAGVPPELARRIVAEYAPPGGLVVDPMCGVGATLIEAAALGRVGIGVEREPCRARLARANLARAAAAMTGPPANVVAGDAGDLPALLPWLVGTADLIATCPPAAIQAHTLSARALPGGGTVGHGSSNPSGNKVEPAGPGHAGTLDQQAGMARIYAACLPMLRPGGLLVVVTEHHRRGGRLLDLAALTVRLATAGGFVYLQHLIALRAAVRGARLVPLPSAGQAAALRAARQGSEPAHLVTHHDVLVFLNPAGTPDADA